MNGTFLEDENGLLFSVHPSQKVTIENYMLEQPRELPPNLVMVHVNNSSFFIFRGTKEECESYKQQLMDYLLGSVGQKRFHYIATNKHAGIVEDNINGNKCPYANIGDNILVEKPMIERMDEFDNNKKRLQHNLNEDVFINTTIVGIKYNKNCRGSCRVFNNLALVYDYKDMYCNPANSLSINCDSCVLWKMKNK